MTNNIIYQTFLSSIFRVSQLSFNENSIRCQLHCHNEIFTKRYTHIYIHKYICIYLKKKNHNELYKRYNCRVLIDTSLDSQQKRSLARKRFSERRNTMEKLNNFCDKLQVINLSFGKAYLNDRFFIVLFLFFLFFFLTIKCRIVF